MRESRVRPFHSNRSPLPNEPTVGPSNIRFAESMDLTWFLRKDRP